MPITTSGFASLNAHCEYFESIKVAVDLFLRYLADKGQAGRFFTLLGK